MVKEEADLKEQAYKISTGNGQIGFPLKKKFSRHLVDTLMHLWDQKFQKFQHRNPLNNGSLSENVMKECERVPFQPLH